MHRHPLITARDLADRLQRGAGASPLLLDVRWRLGADDGYDSYLQGHLPGAVFVDLERDLSGMAGSTGGRHPMPRIDDFELDMAECGVDNDRLVVVYDDAMSFAAARCWWLLRHFGKFDVLVLDGGISAWKAERLPIESGIRLVDEGDFSVRRSGISYLTAETAALYASEGILLDGRPSDRFRGDHDDVDVVSGHIPGSINVPAISLVDESGRLRPREELRARFAAAGVDGEAPVAVTCGSGVQASLLALAISAAGLGGHVPVYIGSWSDWITDPSRPVELGESSRRPGQLT